jgi:hypothetical protein
MWIGRFSMSSTISIPDHLIRERNGIMADKSGIAERLLVQQKAMFRLAAVKGFTQELIHIETELPTTSLSEWATGKTKISMVGTLAIAEIPDFPLDLLSLLLPSGLAVVKVPEGINHDEIADAMVEYLAEKQRAHHPESECGPAIGPNECQKLSGKVVQLRVA